MINYSKHKRKYIQDFEIQDFIKERKIVNVTQVFFSLSKWVNLNRVIETKKSEIQIKCPCMFSLTEEREFDNTSICT